MSNILKRTARATIRFLRFAGRRYYCALCGRSARRFIPVTNYPGQAVVEKYHMVAMGNNAHYRCPWCHSSDKERLVWRYLAERTDFFNSTHLLHVLHVAPERNTRKKFQARPNTDYIHGDMFHGAAKYTPEHYGGAMYLDITDLSSFKDDSFDVIICNHVLEHVPNDLQAMRELRRVLKKEGFAILQVPVSRDIKTSFEDSTMTTDKERLAQFGQSDHVRIYAEKDYIERLKRAGFRIEVIRSRSLFSSNELVSWGVNPEESVYVTRKT